MLVFKCDRCETVNPESPKHYGHIVLETQGRDEVLDMFLCEQCYTTIKEVLEDGEIK